MQFVTQRNNLVSFHRRCSDTLKLFLEGKTSSQFQGKEGERVRRLQTGIYDDYKRASTMTANRRLLCAASKCLAQRSATFKDSL